MPPLLAVLPGALKLAGRLRKPSERYGGKKGPLLGTVEVYLADLQRGGAKGVARLQEMYRLKQRDGAAGWGAVWDNEVRGSALPVSVRAAAEALDPGYFAETTKAAPSAEPDVEKAAPKAKAPKAKAPKRAAAPRAPKVRKVKRYNPDTGRQVSVPEDSEEALSWPSRKASARSRRLASQASGALSRATVSALASGARKMSPALAAKLARAGVAIGGLAAGYFIGSALNKYLAGRHRSKQEAAVQAALAFREARVAAATAKGDTLTADEVRSLGDVYKAQLRALGYAPGTYEKVPSFIDRFFFGEEE